MRKKRARRPLASEATRTSVTTHAAPRPRARCRRQKSPPKTTPLMTPTTSSHNAECGRDIEQTSSAAEQASGAPRGRIDHKERAPRRTRDPTNDRSKMPIHERSRRVRIATSSTCHRQRVVQTSNLPPKTHNRHHNKTTAERTLRPKHEKKYNRVQQKTQRKRNAPTNANRKHAPPSLSTLANTQPLCVKCKHATLRDTKHKNAFTGVCSASSALLPCTASHSEPPDRHQPTQSRSLGGRTCSRSRHRRRRRRSLAWPDVTQHRSSFS